MKRCPTCGKTFADGMKFCQTDGTLLVEVADAAKNDPFKTVVASRDEIASAVPPDPFKTMVAPPKKAEQEISESPEEPDLMKTMVSPPFGSSKEPANTNDEKPVAPPAPFNNPLPQTPLSAEVKPFGSEISSLPVSESPTPKSNPLPNEHQYNQAAKDDILNTPIPSPFDESLIGYQAPSRPLPPFSQSEPIPQSEPDSYNQSPFNQPPAFREAEIKAEALNTPFAREVEVGNYPVEQPNWTPPPAPDMNWQNQEIGQNTPFQPPVAGQGQNKTLAIVSIVCGILSLLCCFSVVTGPAGIVTGVMGKKNAEQNPNEFGGRSLALGGIITGAIGTLLFIVLFVLQVFFGILGGILGSR